MADARASAEQPSTRSVLPLLKSLGLQPFRPRPPWLNGDLQTLRDSLRPVALPPDRGSRVVIPVPPLPGCSSGVVGEPADCGSNAGDGNACGHGSGSSSRQAGLHRSNGAPISASSDALRDAPVEGSVHAVLYGSAQGGASGLADHLLAFLDPPFPQSTPAPLGLVLLMHGLGGSSEREGLRRMGLTLQRAGFAVLRLNMRGAGPGRTLARGSYAACCNSDLLPALRRARELADGLAPGGRPLFGVGISLGGTQLLNALLADAVTHQAADGDPREARPQLDGLVCISSPLDLVACSHQIERPRNRFYERWLLRRLLAQTAADPFGISPVEADALAGRGPIGPLRSIRDFDAAITAPRWGYGSVDDYYGAASPLPRLLAFAEADRNGGLPMRVANKLPRLRWPAKQPDHPPLDLPPALIVHAADDPWVPVKGAECLARSGWAVGAGGAWQVLLTDQGGHNGFHAVCDESDGRGGCWGDRLTACWLRSLL